MLSGGSGNSAVSPSILDALIAKICPRLSAVRKKSYSGIETRCVKRGIGNGLGTGGG